MEESKNIPRMFNELQGLVVKIMGCVLGVSLVGVVTMSVLGSRNYSFHLVSLQSGWTGMVWDLLWFAVCGSTFFILGVVIGKLTDAEEEK